MSLCILKTWVKEGTMYRTSELIQKCRDAGIAVTPKRLYRWVQQGLLLPPLKHRASLGRGQGREEHLWDSSCVDRIILIATVTAERLKPTQAAKVLIAHGFRPSTKVLRNHIRALVGRYDKDVRGKAVRGKQSSREADSLQVASIHRQLAAHCVDLRNVWALIQTGLSRTADGGAVKTSPIPRAASYLSPSSIEQVGKTATDAELVEAFESASLYAPFVKAAIDVAWGCTLPTAEMRALTPLIGNSLLDILKPIGTLKTIRRRSPYPYNDVDVRYLAHMVSMLWVIVYDRHKDSLDILLVLAGLNFVGMLWPDKYPDVVPAVVAHFKALATTNAPDIHS